MGGNRQPRRKHPAVSARVCLDGRYVADGYPGIARYTFNLALALAELPQSLQLQFLYDPSRWSARYDLEELADAGVRTLPTNCPTRTVLEQREMPHLARRHGWNLLHVPFLMAPLRLKCALAVTVYDLVALDRAFGLGGLRRQAYRLLLNAVLRRADSLLTLSASTARELLRYRPGVRDRLRVTSAAVDPRFLAEHGVEGNRGLDLPERYVLTLGNVRRHKNIGSVLGAWATLDTRTRRGHSLVIVGAIRREEQAIAERAGVVLLGVLSEAELRAAYSGAALFIMPSLQEGFGFPALEAMASGTAVLRSSIAVFDEVLGEVSEVFDPRSSDALASALASLLAADGRRAALARRGRERAAKGSWAEVARRSLEAYEDALRSRPAGSES